MERQNVHLKYLMEKYGYKWQNKVRKSECKIQFDPRKDVGNELKAESYRR